jgi:hypothetical protein
MKFRVTTAALVAAATALTGCGEKALLFGFSAGLTALFAVSAAQGYADTASCQELRSEQSWLPGTAR